jgi:hypothetical protein
LGIALAICAAYGASVASIEVELNPTIVPGFVALASAVFAFSAILLIFYIF